MYFPGTPLFYPSMMGSQPAAMLQLRGLKAATIPASGQFTGGQLRATGHWLCSVFVYNSLWVCSYNDIHDNKALPSGCVAAV